LLPIGHSQQASFLPHQTLAWTKQVPDNSERRMERETKEFREKRNLTYILPKKKVLWWFVLGFAVGFFFKRKGWRGVAKREFRQLTAIKEN